MRLCDRLVNSLILLNAPEEVPLGSFRRHVLVIGIAHANFQRDVGSDDRRVVADRLEEYEGHPYFFCDPSLNGGSAEGAVSRTGQVITSETNLRSLVLFVASEHCVRRISSTHECPYRESQRFLRLLATGSAFPESLSLVHYADEWPPRCRG